MPIHERFWRAGAECGTPVTVGVMMLAWRG